MNERDTLVAQVTEIICEGENFVDEPESVAKDIVDKLHDRRSAPTWFSKEVREQAAQYLTAVHGTDWVYRAPETHDNLLERWVRHIAEGALPQAEKTMNEIEDIAGRLKTEGVSL